MYTNCHRKEIDMKIGIIVHSFTGNTASVAEKLQKLLQEKGHEAELRQIRVLGGERTDQTNVELEAPPEVSGYEGLVFGAPVRAFSLSPVMAAYLKQVSSLTGKKIACFVTKQLASKWTGGNRAIKTMRTLCREKGGEISASGMIFWKKQDREEQADQLARSLAVLF